MNLTFLKGNKTKKAMEREKNDEYLRSKVLEEYLIERIEEGEKHRRNNLLDVQRLLKELETQLEFLRR